MKPSENLRPDIRQQDEAFVTRHVLALFQRMPMLCGFRLQRDLKLTDVTVHTWPGYTVGEKFYEDLMQALADLVEERPEAVLLLRGRTFARAFH
jgi:hypothetical protein